MPLKAVCIELRPNLNSGYVFLRFDQEIRDQFKTRLVIKEHGVHVVENGIDGIESELVFRHDSFGIDIQRISAFIVNGCYISFRFSYTTIDMEVLQQHVGLLKPQPLLLNFAERTDFVALHCSSCRYELVPGCNYNRLREYPSGLIDPSEFFCHSHGSEDKAPTLVPGMSDLFYGLNHIVVNTAVLQDRVINRKEHVYCKRCMCMLGMNILGGAAVKLWADALRWIPETLKTTYDTQPVPRPLFKHSTVTQLMLRLLYTLWEILPPIFSPANSRALLVANMPDRHQHFMLIQVLEPQLLMLRRTIGYPYQGEPDTNPQHLHCYRACKLYFRVFGSCPTDQSTLRKCQQKIDVPKMTISPFMFLELQARFNINSTLIPHNCRYNSTDDKLTLTYFFYESDEQELARQQHQPQPHITKAQKSSRLKQQQQQQCKKLEDYEIDAGLDASLDESDDERSDSDSELTSSLLNKSVPIMVYEQNLAKRWPRQKLKQSQSQSECSSQSETLPSSPPGSKPLK